MVRDDRKSGHWWAALAALVWHGLLVVALVRGFAPLGLAPMADALRPVVSAVAFAPSPPPFSAPPVRTHQSEGASGANASKASPAAIVAAPARIVVTPLLAAPAAGPGEDTRSGAGVAGAGTGGAAGGAGTGSGGGGQGAGGRFVATPPVKIAGELVERDYPRSGRAQRLGTAVIVVLTVGEDGHVSACRIHRPSGSPEADALTCQLAQQRFRFRPALDQNGAPIEAPFGWQQRFFWD